MLVKLTRILKFRSHGEIAQVLGEPIQKFLIFQKKYEGLEAKDKEENFSRKISIDLAEIFGLRHSSNEDLIIAPSCTTQNFQCSYLIEISMKHSGFMSNSTDLDFEVCLENSKLHAEIYE